MEGKNNPWTLESPTITSKMESPSVLTVTNMGIWQKNANRRRKNMKPGNVSNMRKKDTLSKTAKKHS